MSVSNDSTRLVHQTDALTPHVRISLAFKSKARLYHRCVEKWDFRPVRYAVTRAPDPPRGPWPRLRPGRTTRPDGVTIERSISLACADRGEYGSRRVFTWQTAIDGKMHMSRDDAVTQTDSTSTVRTRSPARNSNGHYRYRSFSRNRRHRWYFAADIFRSPRARFSRRRFVLRDGGPNRTRSHTCAVWRNYR